MYFMARIIAAILRSSLQSLYAVDQLWASVPRLYVLAELAGGIDPFDDELKGGDAFGGAVEEALAAVVVPGPALDCGDGLEEQPRDAPFVE
jgi:hypothetical protein